MPKLTARIAIPIILAGVFVISAFLAANIDQNNLGLSFYVVLLLLVFYVFSFGIAIGQSFSSPFKKILDRAIELSRGNLSGRVYLKTKDELAELADAFNKIAEELEQSRQQREDAEKSVDIKVKAKTQELEETIYALEQKIKNRTIELQRKTEELERLKQEEAAKIIK